MSEKQQFMDALYEVRALAVRIRQGAYGARDLPAAQRELTRMWGAAMQISSAAAIAGTPGFGSGLVQAAAESNAKAEIIRQQFSVESIDAYIRIVSGA